MINKKSTILNPSKRLHSIHCKKCNKETIFDVGGVKKGNILKCPKCNTVLAELKDEPFMMVADVGIITKSKFNKQMEIPK